MLKIQLLSSLTRRAGSYSAARDIRSKFFAGTFANMLGAGLAAVLLMAGSLPGHAAGLTVVSDFSDIDFWVGSGDAQSGMVIDFNDGNNPQSFVWGYRWDSSQAVSGAEMFTDILAADPMLSATATGTVEDAYFLTSISYQYGGISYSQINEPYDPAGSQSWGYYVAGGTAGGTAMGGGGSSLPDPWTSSPSGAAEEAFGFEGRFLADGAWDAWVYGYYGTAPDGQSFASIPEPNTALLLLFGLAGLFVRKR